MPDRDDDLLVELGELTEEALLVETLMGWDGDPCLCADCDCPRFRDDGPDGRCPECSRGQHWAATANG